MDTIKGPTRNRRLVKPRWTTGDTSGIAQAHSHRDLAENIGFSTKYVEKASKIEKTNQVDEDREEN